MMGVLNVYCTNLLAFSCSSVPPVRYLSEVFKSTWSVTKCIHSSCILNHMHYAAIYSSKQVNTSLHTIFHSHALLLPESTLLCISTLKWWIPGPGCWNLSAQKKKIPCAMYNLWSTWECPILWTINILSFNISPFLSLSLSLLHYISQKSTCVNYGISNSNPCNYTLPLVLIVAAKKERKNSCK